MRWYTKIDKYQVWSVYPFVMLKIYSNFPHKKDIIFFTFRRQNNFDGVVVGNFRIAKTYLMIMKKKALWTHGKSIFCQSKSLHHTSQIHTSGLTSRLNSTSKAVVKPNKIPMWWFIYIAKVKYSQGIFKVQFHTTRSYAALRAADLDWIVRPGYILGGYN